MDVKHHAVNPKVKGYIAIFGGIVVNLTMGLIYAFGNILPYLASFMASHNGNTEEMYVYYLDQLTWLFTIQLVSNGIFTLVGAKCETIYGHRKTAACGCLLYTLGVVMTYFSIKSDYSFAFTCITLGVMTGVGVGTMYISPIACVIRWFPNNIGFATGSVLVGFGLSAPLFDLLFTIFINPNNVKQDINTGFLNQYDVLDNVPTVFLKLAAIICSLQVVGISCLLNDSTAAINIKTPTPNKMEMAQKTSANQEKVKLLTLDDEKSTNKATKRKLVSLLKNKIFWNLYFTMFTGGIGLFFTSTQWKIFINQHFKIENDRMLMLIGAVSISFNAAGRVGWGTIFDRIHIYKLINGTLFIVLSIFIATFPILSYIANRNVLIMCCFVWLSIIYFCLGGTNPLYLSQLSDVFGSRDAGMNFAMIYTSYIPGGLLSTFAITSMRTELGWMRMSAFIGCIVFTGFILVLMVDTTKYKETKSFLPKSKLSQDKMRALSYLSI